MRKLWKTILVVLVLILILGLLYYAWDFFIPSNELASTVNWQVYRNEEHGFEIKYPKDWQIEEGTETTDGLRKFSFSFAGSQEEALVLGNNDAYGRVLVDFFYTDNHDTLDALIDVHKKMFLDSSEEIVLNGVKGYKGVMYYESGRAENMQLEEIFLDKANRRICRIIGEAIDLDEEFYQDQIKLVVSTFWFLDKE